jgi:hypothetical protein
MPDAPGWESVAALQAAYDDLLRRHDTNVALIGRVAVREARTALMSDERLHAHSAHERSATAGLDLTAWCLGCRWARRLEEYATAMDSTEGGDGHAD